MSFPLSIEQEREIIHAHEKRIESEVDHVPLNYPWEVENEQDRPSDLLQRHALRMKKKRSDITAGLSVGFMVVPQGMSYAGLAGLPSVYGLYGAFLPCIIYTLVGSSKQLAVGPVAVTSLIISANLQRIVSCANDIENPNKPPPGLEACQDQYNKAAIQLAFIVAMLYTGVGILRLGWVTKFLSHAVISGFTTGAAVTIGMGQVKYLLGYTHVKYLLGFSVDMGHSTRVQDYIAKYIAGINQFRWQEWIMGTTMIFVLVFLREAHRINKKLRYIRSFGPLLMCAVGICAVYIGKVNTPERGNVKVIGFIPSGLPGVTIGWWTPMVDPSFTDLIPTAIIVMIVDLLESTSIARALARKRNDLDMIVDLLGSTSIARALARKRNDLDMIVYLLGSTSIARALARKNGYELVYNREIIGLGLANIVGAAFNSYTTTGSFSRSAVNDMAGAKTPLAQTVCGLIVMFVLLFLTNVFAKLPFNVLGAIVIVSVSGLFEFEQAIYLWKVNNLIVWAVGPPHIIPVPK
eukprot:gene25822-11497_t